MFKFKLFCFVLFVFFSSFFITEAGAVMQSMDDWKPSFDPKGAKYKCLLSNVSHPAIKGIYAGFVMRDLIWERTGGQIYIDFKPFGMLGGEVEVLNQLQMGAVQGMACSSVASTNLGPRFGLITLPFLIDSFDKLDKFIGNKKLFDHFLMAMDHQGISALDITGYGGYGWAATIPVKSIKEAEKVKFRTAEAAVNQLIYNSWGIHPVAMPWPDVPMALRQGVIDGLDHTPIVCSISKKFEVCKYFTKVNYAQGLYIWLFNKRWLNRLPDDLRKIFIDTVNGVCRDIRKQTRQQENEEIAKAKDDGVTFFELSNEDINILKQKSALVYDKYAPQINKLYDGDKYRPKDYLREVKFFIESRN